jgi:50S ribosomal protein L16 3-hydroxylase
VSVNLFAKNWDREYFLQHYWQKKPLLIRAGHEHFEDPIDPETLAGLACEDFIESRLILSDAGQSHWTLRNGPFTEQDFTTLPPSHWSLLVQAVEQWDDEVRALLQAFDFIPRWRIDDIMISLAADQGSVGPHFDYYDVFLIQGAGKKHWRLGGTADSNSALLPGTELRLLQDFKTEQEWVVGPGDILYLPPNIAHYGVAIGTSLTYSVGFRTPSVAEIIDDVSHELIQSLREDQRYTDTAPRLPHKAGEIQHRTADELYELINTHLQDKTMLLRCFGSYMTRPKYPDLIPTSSAPVSTGHLQSRLQAGVNLQRNPASRFAFTESTHEEITKASDGGELFADGHTLHYPTNLASLVRQCCDPFAPEPDWCELFLTSTAHADFITQLYNNGSLLAEDADE